jgi:hypothetical protein
MVASQRSDSEGEVTHTHGPREQDQGPGRLVVDESAHEGTRSHSQEQSDPDSDPADGAAAVDRTRQN